MASQDTERDADGYSLSSTLDNDDKVLQDIGYKNSFKREFTNLATVRFLSKTLCTFAFSHDAIFV